MPFDGLTATYIAQELKMLISAKVERIHQPQKDMLLIYLRSQKDNLKLLISANANFARVHLTNNVYQNPMQPPLFCMVLRKHLEGFRIRDVIQHPMERSFCIVFSGVDEIGRQVEKKLFIEIMGKHSNIILTTSDGIILDGIKRYTHEISRYRQILPGEEYVAPPSQDKLNLIFLNEELFSNLLFSKLSAKKLSNILQEVFLGISSQTALEWLARANIEPDLRGDEVGDYELIRLWQAWNEIKPDHEPSPTVVKNLSRELDFFPYAPVYLNGEQIFYPTISEAADAFYSAKEKREKFLNQQSDILKVIRNLLEKAKRKLSLQEEDLLKAEDASIYRIYGELITSNLWNLPERASEITLENFYDGKKLTIPLEKELTIAANAQKYFKKYNKAKQTLTYLTSEIEETKKEIAYLEEVENAAELAETTEDIEEIRKELEAEGYIKAKQLHAKKKKEPQSTPLSFESPDGFKIYVGKNNLQNDRLTLKFANVSDIWLHTKDIPGAHVIIRTEGKDVPYDTILFAAQIAARHSKARFGSQVPVDYTEVKNVKKPSGAKPGFVIYEKQKTVYVTP